ncbi:MAG: glycosyltransferase family 9 protein [Candidatus Omnitrophica bacterium]|nr:glycosyltransferase family 9 protein [Candidatus Omnitrophota bacterium]
MENKISSLEPKKILIVDLGGIGDIVLSIPALKALRRRFNQAVICMLVVRRVCDLVESFSYIDEVYTLYKDKRHILFDLTTLHLLRKKNFDLAINMRTIVSKAGAKKIKFILDIINPRLRVGRDTDSLGYFFDIKIPETYLAKKHEMDYHIDTALALGVEVKDRSITLDIPQEASLRLKDVLAGYSITDNDTVVGIHPGGMPSRRWPIERFAEAMQQLHRNLNCKFVVTGSKSEISLVNRLIEISRISVLNMAGKSNLKELIALIKYCDVFISNDTGPMHIAAALKIPLVAILGAGDFVRYNPRSISDKTVVLYKKRECSPCERFRCKTLDCLKSITPAEVVGAVSSLLKKTVQPS